MTRTPGRGGSGARELKVRVKTARRRKNASRRWLERQLNDPYVKAARRDGYRSRAAYKLIEIDDRFKLLGPGARVLDLGAAPGGWSQVAVQRTRNGSSTASVVALDINPMEPVAGARFVQMDFMSDEATAALCALAGRERFDVVLSDMAAPATGHRRTDHLKIMGLCEAAADTARRVLRPRGAFLAKVLKGGTERELLMRLRRDYETVRHVKPKASRAGSSESYVLATGFRGDGA